MIEPQEIYKWPEFQSLLKRLNVQTEGIISFELHVKADEAVTVHVKRLPEDKSTCDYCDGSGRKIVRWS